MLCLCFLLAPVKGCSWVKVSLMANMSAQVFIFLRAFWNRRTYLFLIDLFFVSLHCMIPSRKCSQGNLWPSLASTLIIFWYWWRFHCRVSSLWVIESTFKIIMKKARKTFFNRILPGQHFSIAVQLLTFTCL